ncbi:hypothetical protein ACEUZ9_000301 [Paracoccus litorisediminis]|uniref:hypothetical protein n=1 Tax=Paracoccus litorisediminis TaxID=2006130 RepID=UPI003730C32C
MEKTEAWTVMESQIAIVRQAMVRHEIECLKDIYVFEEHLAGLEELSFDAADGRAQLEFGVELPQLLIYPDSCDFVESREICTMRSAVGQLFQNVAEMVLSGPGIVNEIRFDLHSADGLSVLIDTSQTQEPNWVKWEPPVGHPDVELSM